MSKHISPPGLRLRLVLDSGDWIGPGKADLLQGIAETGSISAAGKRMAMSYKRAWGLVEQMNGMFAAPLVEATRGGAGHGGAGLTVTGQQVLAHFRAMQAQAETALGPDMAAIRALGADIPGQK